LGDVYVTIADKGWCEVEKLKQKGYIL